MPILIFISLFTLLDFVILFSIGSQIGLLTTLLLVLGTGFAGLHLIRKEGVSTLARARQRMQVGELPSSELFTGAALIFLSDALGLACLIPSARQLLFKALTWLGLKTVVGKQQGPHASSTHSYTSEERVDEAFKDANSQDASSAYQEGPIEGDFISRDEPSRRR